MFAYMDSSALLREVLNDPSRLREWQSITKPIVSAVGEVECMRTLDRIRLSGAMLDERLAEARNDVYTIMARAEVVSVSPEVLARASMPLPIPLKTLDAIHLATAQLWRERTEEALVFATHDVRQGMAARSVGFAVIGV